MTDDLGRASPGVCPWCSADLAGDAGDTCTRCGAKLDGDADAPGLTSVDSTTIERMARAPIPQRRSRLLSWITGDDGEAADDSPAPPGSLAPPPPDVRREMLRMALEAEVAELQAEVGALAAEARETGDDRDREVLEAVADNAAEIRAEVAAVGPVETSLEAPADSPAVPPEAAGSVDPERAPG